MTMVLQLNLLNLSRIDVMYSTNSSILSNLLFILFCFFVFVVAYECVEVYLFFLLCFFFAILFSSLDAQSEFFPIETML